MVAFSIFVVALLSLLHSTEPRRLSLRGEPDEENQNVKNSTVLLRMPGIVPKKDDDYICMPFKMGEHELYITHFKANATAERAHHILLYGCSSVRNENEPWDCGHHGVCTGSQSILFAWAKNAPPTDLPPSVGFRIGGATSVKYLVMQIHYAHPLAEDEKDYSGLDLEVTSEEQKYIAGIHLMVGQNVLIPPHQPIVHADVNCVMRPSAPLHLFAFRVHAHKLSRVITGYRIINGKIEEIARGNPQWPQAFYPMKQVFEVNTGDFLAARCTYNTTEKNTVTYIGSTAGDEMCNLYLMYYTDAKQGTPYGVCADEQTSTITKSLPADSDKPLPPNPLLEEHAIHGTSHSNVAMNHTQMVGSKTGVNLEEINYETLFGKNDSIPVPEKKGSGSGHKKKPLNDLDTDNYPTNDQYDDNKNVDYDYKSGVQEARPTLPETVPSNPVVYEDRFQLDANWPAQLQSQPSAVGVDSKGNIIIFHRGNRAWDQNTFNYENKLTNPQLGPIADPTLVLLEPETGKLLNKAGNNMFYLPHGLTVDHEDNLWVTDVGAHQVFKLTPLNSTVSSVQVLLELGKSLQPGSDAKHFCKPTSVAVLPSGEFFVADGYCNSRIIKYDRKGNRLFEWGESPRTLLGFNAGKPGPNTLNVPHSLALFPEKELICVADRENGRILCYTVGEGNFQMQIQRPEFHAVYGIAAQGSKLYAVNNAYGSETARGFVFDMDKSGALVGYFASSGSGLGQPHWLAVKQDGSQVYVAEIHPYRIQKFIQKINGKVMAFSPAPVNTAKVPSPTVAPAGDVSANDSVLFSSWGITLSVIGVPILFMVLLLLIIRLHKRGGICQCCSTRSGQRSKLDLGSLLGHRDPSRGGFEKLALDDSDAADSETDSDAEVVEFSQTNKGLGLKA